MFGTTSITGSKGSALSEALSSIAECFMRALKPPGQQPSGSNSPTQTSSRSPLLEIGVSLVVLGDIENVLSRYIVAIIISQYHHILTLALNQTCINYLKSQAGPHGNLA